MPKFRSRSVFSQGAHSWLTPACLTLGSCLSATAMADDSSNIELESMVVTATMSARPIETAPAFTTVLSAEEIESAPVDSLGDLLRANAGLNNLTDSNGRDDIQIRGLDSDYTMILINGKRVSSGGAFAKGSDVDFNSIPVSSIERIEVIRGPMAALYGSDAIGGVINIITKKSAGEWRGSVSGEYTVVDSGEDGGRYRLGGTVMGSLNDKVSLSVSADQYSRDAWYANDADEVPEQEEKTASNLTSTLTVDLDEQQSIDIDLGYNHDDRPYQLYGTSSYRDQTINRYDLALTHTGQWSNASTTAYIKYEHSDVDDYNTSYDIPQHHTKETNLYAKAYGHTSLGMNDLVAGFDFRHQELEDPVNYVETGKYSIDQAGVFVQDELALTDQLTLTLGGRWDHHEIFGGHFSPKSYLVYQLNDAVTLKGGVGKAFKAPDGRKLSPEYNEISCGGSCYIPGNPDLEPETSITKELGVEVRQPYWSLSADVFDTEVKDKIERELGEADEDGVYSPVWVNLSKVTSKGYEVSGDLDLTDSLVVTGNYTRLIVKDEDDAVIEYRPEHQSNLGIKMQATDALSASLNVNYVGGMTYSYWADSQTNVRKLSYYRTDLGFLMDMNEAVQLKFGVNNIGDINLTDMDDNISTVELGRNYYFGGTYYF
ncbi:TonB-dependent siderophore receptor [Oceanobacter sp. 4_MG-2023]|uniref:TonB-dependent receptor plug domain-containing protein n=2 Tax=Gammaproteobacteria TaxID=1236 RepID=UPI0027364E50|nr:TonB-dependent receptor [Oceanobacter sp. 4_MG-2023]MDP2547624.1 TonB-dependent receptor [Oceanobacter sp. 4_MG-2023]